MDGQLARTCHTESKASKCAHATRWFGPDRACTQFGMGETSAVVDDRVPSDDLLAECARQGNAAAFSALVARYRQGVYVIAQNMLVSSRDIAEVTKETFLSVHRNLPTWPRMATFATWLYRIAIKTALARRLRRPCSLEPFLPRFDREGRLVPGIDRWPELESVPERIGIGALLREALEFMDDGLVAAFVLRDLVELPVGEVAAILETSPEDIGRSIHRARLMLHGLLVRL